MTGFSDPREVPRRRGVFKDHFYARLLRRQLFAGWIAYLRRSLTGIYSQYPVEQDGRGCVT